MRILAVAGAIVLATMMLPAALAGDFVSKGYEFKANKILEVGLELPGGVRFDTIEFKVANAEGSPDGGSKTAREKPRAIVTISNLGTEPARVGIALAVVDADGHLLAAASGGTKAFPLRTERKMAYSIAFEDVVARFADATAFRIAIETLP